MPFEASLFSSYVLCVEENAAVNRSRGKRTPLYSLLFDGLCRWSPEADAAALHTSAGAPYSSLSAFGSYLCS